MQINSYLTFPGNCRQAMEFYAEAFGVEMPTQISTYGDMPASPEYPMTDEVKNYIMHACVKLGDSEIMFADAPPNLPVVFGNVITLTIQDSDPEKLKVTFNKLAEGGKILMPLEETFFSKCYGYLCDKFEIFWQVVQQ